MGEWVLSKPEVKKVFTRNEAALAKPVLAVVTHSNLLEQTLPKHNYEGHVHNTLVLNATVPVDSGHVGSFSVAGVVYDGGQQHGDNLLLAELLGALVFAGIAFGAYEVWKTRCAGAGSDKGRPLLA